MYPYKYLVLTIIVTNEELPEKLSKKFQILVRGFLRNIPTFYKIVPWFNVFNANIPLGEIKIYNV